MKFKKNYQLRDIFIISILIIGLLLLITYAFDIGFTSDFGSCATILFNMISFSEIHIPEMLLGKRNIRYRCIAYIL